jgi:hypothetical protein
MKMLCMALQSRSAKGKLRPLEVDRHTSWHTPGRGLAIHWFHSQACVQERKKERKNYALGRELRKKRSLQASLPYTTPKEPKPCGRVNAQQTIAIPPEGKFDKGQAESQRAGCAAVPHRHSSTAAPPLLHARLTGWCCTRALSGVNTVPGNNS